MAVDWKNMLLVAKNIPVVSRKNIEVVHSFSPLSQKVWLGIRSLF